MRRDLGFDHRHRVRNPVAPENFVEQDARSQRRAGKLTPRRESVPVNVRHQQPPAVFRRDVGHRHCRQPERRLEEGKGIEVPARLLRAWDIRGDERRQREPTPRHQRRRHMALSGVIGKRQQRLTGSRQSQRLQVREVRAQRHFAAEDRIGLINAQARIAGNGLSGEPQGFQCCGIRIERQAIQKGDRHTRRGLPDDPVVQELRASRRVREPKHDAGKTCRRNILRQRLPDVEIIHEITKMVDRHFEKAMNTRVVQCRCLARIVENSDVPRHNLAYTHTKRR